MFASRFIPRAFPLVALSAGLLLAACGETPTAPQFEQLPTVEAEAEAPAAKAGHRLPASAASGTRHGGRRLPGEQLAGRRTPGFRLP